MSDRITIGIDNGQSGSVGIVAGSLSTTFSPVPTKPYLHYGKKGSIGQRLDRARLIDLLSNSITDGFGHRLFTPRVFIERPFSGKFINAVVPAHRFFEGTIIVMEDMNLGYEVVDSREWQAAMLGKVRGSTELKLASKLRGIQMYPQFRDTIEKQGDADGLLLAHYYHFRQ